MTLTEAFRLALAGLAANRLRAVLTTLGIVIGVSAVLSLVSLGQGVQGYIENEFARLGSNMLVVIPQQPSSPTRTRREPLTTLEAAALSDPSIAPDVAQVALDYRLSGTIQAGSESITTQISGVTPNFTQVRTWNPQPGSEFITAADVQDASRVVVMGVGVVEDLYGDKIYNPVGETVRINGRVFTVIGVMEELGSALLSDDDAVYVPLSTAQTRLSRARTRDGGYEVTVMYISATSKERMDAATAQIQAYLDEAHNVSFDGEQDYSVANQGDILDTINQITGLLTVVLGLISGISLLVGGIGIMNIMLVSVTERTREIGLRKAVGARGGDIMTQFLIESIVLSFLGGLIGVLIGFLVTVVGTAAIPGLTLSLTPDAIMLATGVSSFVGIFFGLYPASRAARMRPIDALRFE